MERMFVKRKVACFAAVAMVLATAGTSLAQTKRRPVPRPTIDQMIEHAPTGNSVRLNPRTGQSEEYPLEGEVVLDDKTGYFRLSWNGIDGRRKTLIWEPPWNVDAVVAASVDYDLNARLYRYAYTMQSLPSSGKKIESLYAEVRAAVEKVEAPDGTWHSDPFTEFVREKLGVTAGRIWSQAGRGLNGLLPGQRATGFAYSSAGLPAIVKCFVRAHTRGHSAGEEAPTVLVDAIVKYNWMVPQGYTIGPDERLAKMSLEERLSYLVERLPKMLELGWIENQKVMGRYDTNLKAGKAAEVRARAEADFKRNLITSEVFALMTYLTK